MKKRWIALLLILAALCSLTMMPALADEETAAPPILIMPAPGADSEGMLSFENMQERMLGGYYPLLALEENIAAIGALDYDELSEDLKEKLGQVVGLLWGAITAESQMGGNTPLGSIVGMIGDMQAVTLRQQQEALQENIDSIKNGEMQQDNADLIRQLQHTENSVVKMGQTLYITLLGLEENALALERSEVALARTIEELQLRYNLGQISALTLQEAEAGMTQLVSGKATLNMNIEQLYAQIAAMVGEDITEKLVLGALPEVTAEQLASMDVERDLGLAKEASFDLYSAKLTLEEAEETYLEAEDDYRDGDYQLTQAKHSWQAAQYTYNGSVQNFELAFRKLYAQVHDCAQILEASKVSLEAERAKLDAAQVKYAQGNLAHNKLLEAEEAVYTAQDTVNAAARDLFSAYNNYSWAVEDGLLES